MSLCLSCRYAQSETQARAPSHTNARLVQIAIVEEEHVIKFNIHPFRLEGPLLSFPVDECSMKKILKSSQHEKRLGLCVYT